MNEYGVIFDKSVSIEDKLHFYIKKKYNHEIEPDNIKKYISGLYSELLK